MRISVTTAFPAYWENLKEFGGWRTKRLVPCPVWRPPSSQTSGWLWGPWSPCVWSPGELSSSHLLTPSPSSGRAFWTCLQGPEPSASAHGSKRYDQKYIKLTNASGKSNQAYKYAMTEASSRCFFSGHTVRSGSCWDKSSSKLCSPGFNILFQAKDRNLFFHFKILTDLWKMIRRICAWCRRVFRDLHLCCVCPL